MSLTVVLAVGLDSSFLESQTSVWQSSECVVTFAGSLEEAIGRFRDGDFDLVLLGHSIPADSREKLTRLIRATGSQVPVVEVVDSSGACKNFEEITSKIQPVPLMEGVGAILANRARTRAAIPTMTRFAK
jgi:CheY-like chemotaxis protein